MARESQAPQHPPVHVILITGATGGLGRALARVFARNGASLLLVSRRIDELEGLAQDLRAEFGVLVLTHMCDLAERSSIATLKASVSEQRLSVHTLINNAGVGDAGEFSASSAVRTFDVNIGAPLRLIEEFLPAMKARNEGGILNIASIAGLAPVPYLAAYSASKAALITLSNALAGELAGTNIRISVAAPGPLDTEFLNRSGLASQAALKIYPSLAPSLAAEAIYEGYVAGQREIYPGFLTYMAAIGAKILPQRLVSRIAGRMLGVGSQAAAQRRERREAGSEAPEAK